MPRNFKPLAALLALTLSACATAQAPEATTQAPPEPEPVIQPEIATGWTAKDPVEAKEFMIAAANPLAAKAGYDMLKRGGAAIDAAIAAQAVLTLVEPQSSGIGGGGFMLYWDNESRRLTSWDGRETAPPPPHLIAFSTTPASRESFTTPLLAAFPSACPACCVCWKRSTSAKDV